MIDDCYVEDVDRDDGLEADALEDEEVRYGLTALGLTVLEERPGFAGFGPCAASWPSRDRDAEPKPELRRSARRKKLRSTPLFG